MERRTLLRYREALNDRSAYARLPVSDRDVIVRWVEIRRRLAETHDLDHDGANLADQLLPYASLRSLVIAGELLARGIDLATGVRQRPDPGGDLQAAVARIRSA